MEMRRCGGAPACEREGKLASQQVSERAMARAAARMEVGREAWCG